MVFPEYRYDIAFIFFRSLGKKSILGRFGPEAHLAILMVFESL